MQAAGLFIGQVRQAGAGGAPSVRSERDFMAMLAAMFGAETTAMASQTSGQKIEGESFLRKAVGLAKSDEHEETSGSSRETNLPVGIAVSAAVVPVTDLVAVPQADLLTSAFEKAVGAEASSTAPVEWADPTASTARTAVSGADALSMPTSPSAAVQVSSNTGNITSRVLEQAGMPSRVFTSPPPEKCARVEGAADSFASGPGFSAAQWKRNPALHIPAAVDANEAAEGNTPTTGSHGGLQIESGSGANGAKGAIPKTSEQTSPATAEVTSASDSVLRRRVCDANTSASGTSEIAACVDSFAGVTAERAAENVLPDVIQTGFPKTLPQTALASASTTDVADAALSVVLKSGVASASPVPRDATTVSAGKVQADVIERGEKPSRSAIASIATGEYEETARKRSGGAETKDVARVVTVLPNVNETATEPAVPFVLSPPASLARPEMAAPAAPVQSDVPVPAVVAPGVLAETTQTASAETDPMAVPNAVPIGGGKLLQARQASRSAEANPKVGDLRAAATSAAQAHGRLSGQDSLLNRSAVMRAGAEESKEDSGKKSEVVRVSGGPAAPETLAPAPAVRESGAAVVVPREAAPIVPADPATPDAPEARSTPQLPEPIRAADGALPSVRFATDSNGEVQMHVGMRTTAFGAVEIYTSVHQNQVGVALQGERGIAHWFSPEVPSLESGLKDHQLHLTTIEMDRGGTGLQTSTGSRQGGDAEQSFHGLRSWQNQRGPEREKNHDRESAVARLPMLSGNSHVNIHV